MLIDTIPLVVKFFSQAGPYDALVDREEVRYARERTAWLKSYNKYMDDLSDGRLLHLTQNKPLEKALIEGIDSSRAAKAFVENLLDLETAFEERVETEKARLADEKRAPAPRTARSVSSSSPRPSTTTSTIAWSRSSTTMRRGRRLEGWRDESGIRGALWCSPGVDGCPSSHPQSALRCGEGVLDHLDPGGLAHRRSTSRMSKRNRTSG